MSDGTAALTQPPAAPQQQGTQPPATKWYDDQFAPVVAAKGWQSPNDALQSYRALEQFMGADKAGRGVIWPKDETDTEGWSAVYAKLGRPEKPDGYKLPDALIADEVATKFREHAHGLGLSASQFEKVVGWYTEQMSAAEKAVVNAQKAADEADMAKLKSDWGGEYDSQVELARRAARQFGVDEKQLQALESVSGSAGLVRLFNKIGRALGEDRAPGGEGSGGFGLTPESAREKIAALTGDAGFRQRLLSGDVTARAEWDRLHKALG